MQTSAPNSRNKGGAIALGVVAFISTMTLAFAPGVGCSSTSAEDSALQAKQRAMGRHKLQAVSNFMVVQAKLEKMRQASDPGQTAQLTTTPQLTTTTAAQATQTPTVTQAKALKLVAFRVGVVLGAWSRYIAKPFSAGGGGMTPVQRRTATLALRGLSTKLTALHEAASAANLSRMAITAQNFNDAIPPLAGGIKTGKIEGADFAKGNTSAQRLRQGARDAKLKFLETVPVNFLPRSG